MRMLLTTGTFWLVCLFVLCPVELGQAGDWPQILGPTRNGKAQGERLARHWPAAGPKSVWQREVGSGFAGVAVADGKVVLFHRVGDEEVVEAMDAGAGKRLWKQALPTNYVSTIAPDDGPRCVPVVDEGRVFVHGAEGRLACLGLDDGKIRWTRDTQRDFDLRPSYFGAGSTPIVVDGKLLINVGGQDQAGIVALDAKTGKAAWQATDEAASYSSPVAATIAGRTHVIFLTRLNAVSVDPGTGDVRFRFPFGQRGPTVNGANPLVLGRHLFLSASYGVGAALVKIASDGADVVWQRDDVMSSQYTTCVEHQGTLYGIDGRQDVGVARLRAFDPLTGKVHWTEEGFGMATLIEADGLLVIVKTDGELVLAEASPSEYRKLKSATIFRATTRALPALADGRLYVRDTKTLKCVDLSPR